MSFLYETLSTKPRAITVGSVVCAALLLVGCNLLTSFEPLADSGEPCGVDAGACVPTPSTVSFEDLAAIEDCPPIGSEDVLPLSVAKGDHVVVSFKNQCVLEDQAGGQIVQNNVCTFLPSKDFPLCVVMLESLDIEEDATLRVRGPDAVALFVDGDVTIAGGLDASATGTTEGPGGGPAGAAGLDGDDADSNLGGEGGMGTDGGGGGGSGGLGGGSGCGSADGGVSFGDPCNPARRLGGGGGGGGARDSVEPPVSQAGHGGGGGGWVEVFSRGTITVEQGATLEARGGDGNDGEATPTISSGGGGGGGGGTVVLEARRVVMRGTIDVSGGGGGQGASNGVSSANGGVGGGASGTSDGVSGSCDRGVGGGGGGGAGQAVVTTCEGELESSGTLVPTAAQCTVRVFAATDE